MTASLLPARVLPLRLLSRASAPTTVYSTLRVNHDANAAAKPVLNIQDTRLRLIPLVRSRLYATDTPSSRPSRPKAHTGRTPASTRTASKGTSPGTAKSRSNSKSALQNGKVKAKPKQKTKAKAKPKRKPKKRKVLSEEAKAKLERRKHLLKERQLKETALLHPPKQLPGTAYLVLTTEASGKGQKLAEVSKEVSAKYRNLAPEEHERANHIANENKAKNEAAYKKWLSSFTPSQIKAANNARMQLRRMSKAAGGKKTYPKIQDERQVKRPNTPYTFFFMERLASGDMKQMKVQEIGPLAGREWRALPAQEKKKYEDMHAQDKSRYIQEYKAVYGEDPPFQKGS